MTPPGFGSGLILNRGNRPDQRASTTTRCFDRTIQLNSYQSFSMSLNEVWEASSATPFSPLVSKDSQFAVGFNLIVLGMHSSPQLLGHN